MTTADRQRQSRRPTRQVSVATANPAHDARTAACPEDHVDDDVGAGGEVQEPPTVARHEHWQRAFVRVVHGELMLVPASVAARGVLVAGGLENVCAPGRRAVVTISRPAE